MALNFPINPEDGDTYEGYVYDATAGVWNSDPHQIASRFVTSATAPSNASEGDGWFDTNTAKSYVFYDGVWVQLGALGTVDLNQIADVSVSSPANGESLVYDGTDWTNQNVSVDVYDVSTDSTGKLALPSGTTEQRPESPNAGDIRFNTTIGEPEYYSEAEGAWFLFRERPTSEFSVEYLVVAGGGGGGGDNGGGGGAGGYRSNVPGEFSGQNSVTEPALSLATGSYTLTIGAGGAGTINTPNGNVPRGSSGQNSIFGSIQSIGGGGGGAGQGLSTGTGTGLPGGSGGGGGSAYPSNGSQGFGGSGTTGQGFSGADGNSTASPERGGGGGGAGAAGETGVNNGGAGGDGIYSSIGGVSIIRAGGGGGGAASGTSVAPGGSGGGGAGSTNGINVTPGSGQSNTGGGGGAAVEAGTAVGGNGGSGIVIFKIPSSISVSFTAGISEANAGNGQTIGDYTTYTITAGTGTVTFS
jgi:hypothetical protein